jgi:gliding-associated putative ABC transporter substrate-binding component GldG
MKKNHQQNILALVKLIIVLTAINIAGNFFYKRFDLTQDHRYTLSAITNEIVDRVKEPMIIDVFLEGKFPQEFRRLQNETKQLLEEFEIQNSNIKFQFINPLQEGATQEEVMQELFEYGLKPVTVTVNDKGTQTQQVVYPWAIVSQGEKASRVQLLKNMIGANTEEKVITSVQHLEYAFAEAIDKITTEKQKSIAILKGNGQLDDAYIADFLLTVRENYHIAPFTLDSVVVHPQKTLKELKDFDLIVVAKPDKEFSEKQIEVLDQFIMNGGKSLWLLDQVQADFDSLRTDGSMLAYAKDQSLGEMLFKYGVRINPVLVKDEISTPIKIAIGKQGSETQYGQFIWKFAPFVYPEINHPIVKNIEGVKFDFASPMDTLKNDIRKTVLLQSSKYSMLVGTPTEINLNILNEESTPEMFENKGSYILGVLLEGQFKSVFQNRILPFKVDKPLYKSEENKMIIISDGDIIKNHLDQNYQPLELGYDKWINKLYGNKELIMNSVNYLMDDRGLINLRTKEVKIPMLDKVKVYQDYNYIQMLTFGLPVLLIAVFGLIFTFLRRRSFVKK